MLAAWPVLPTTLPATEDTTIFAIACALVLSVNKAGLFIGTIIILLLLNFCLSSEEGIAGLVEQAVMLKARIVIKHSLVFIIILTPEYYLN